MTHFRRSPVSRPETAGRQQTSPPLRRSPDDIDQYRFHPALIDGAFQTLIGTTLLERDTDEDAYLPTRIRRSAIYRAPEAPHDRQDHCGVGDQR